MESSYNYLEKLRREYQPPLPEILIDLRKVRIAKERQPIQTASHEEVQKLFPNTYEQFPVHAKPEIRPAHPAIRVGVVFSGGQAPGGHNVITGLFDALQELHAESRLFGFLAGPSGIIEGRYKELTQESLFSYRNQGGFDCLGSGRTKIETEEQLLAAVKLMQSLDLDGLVIIGGDDSNTNAAILAEYFAAHGCRTRVVGVPKTIDGDLRNTHVPISFGFDTACKVYAEMIGNIERDALSARKYYHFIKLMGRSASNIALECALATHPNYTFIGEEVAQSKKSFAELIRDLCDLICRRADLGKDYGVVLIPEGLVEFIPEVKTLIQEIQRLGDLASEKIEQISAASLSFFRSLPERLQQQLLLERDPHGNVQLSHIETERLFIDQVHCELAKRKTAGAYKGKFSAVQHFFGYEGRSCLPSNFDANYCYTLGRTAALLIEDGFSGYLCSVKNLARPVAQWQVGGVPLTMLIHFEERKGKRKPVIQKALVDLEAEPFLHFSRHRDRWALEDDYRYPGPMQFFGDPKLTDSTPMILM